MAQIKPHTLSGFMELLPQPQLQMEAIMEVLRRTYGLYGFTPLDTPAIEAAAHTLTPGAEELPETGKQNETTEDKGETENG